MEEMVGHPKVFYKYRPADNFTIALLEKQEMKFSHAEEYNDPFDSRVTINVTDNIDSILLCLEETPMGESKKQDLRNSIRNGEFGTNHFLESAYETAKRTVMSSCFSVNYENLLLWSHYADSHKGICIGFRNCSSTNIPGMKFNVEDCCSESEYSDGLFPVYKVDYSGYGPIEWKPFEDNFKIFMDAHQIKAEFWEYEEEYRLLLATKAFTSKILCFDPRLLVEVYLGCCIETDFKTKVLQVLNANYLSKGIDVKVYQMIRSKKRFALEMTELAPPAKGDEWLV